MTDPTSNGKTFRMPTENSLRYGLALLERDLRRLAWSDEHLLTSGETDADAYRQARLKSALSVIRILTGEDDLWA